ncbi:MAG: hypothetical protein WA705_30815 [Candidatus Ozemobacteraceae bacterium]
MAKHFSESPHKIFFQAELFNAWFCNCKLSLFPGVVDDFPSYRHKAPETSMTKNREIQIEVLKEKQAEVGFQLVSDIYTWFGIPLEGIPYTSQNAQGTRFIDPSKISKKR